MNDYSEMVTTARKLLNEYGLSMTLIRQTAGAYDPATGAITVTPGDQTGLVAVFNKVGRDIDGTLIKQGDKKLLVSAAVITATEVNDTVIQALEVR